MEFISAVCLQRFLSVHNIGVFPFQSLSARSTNRYFDHLRGGIVEDPFLTLSYSKKWEIDEMRNDPHRKYRNFAALDFIFRLMD